MMEKEAFILIVLNKNIKECLNNIFVMEKVNLLHRNLHMKGFLNKIKNMDLASLKIKIIKYMKENSFITMKNKII